MASAEFGPGRTVVPSQGSSPLRRNRPAASAPPPAGTTESLIARLIHRESASVSITEAYRGQRDDVDESFRVPVTIDEAGLVAVLDDDGTEAALAAVLADIDAEDEVDDLPADPLSLMVENGSPIAPPFPRRAAARGAHEQDGSARNVVPAPSSRRAERERTASSSGGFLRRLHRTPTPPTHPAPEDPRYDAPARRDHRSSVAPSPRAPERAPERPLRGPAPTDAGASGMPTMPEASASIPVAHADIPVARAPVAVPDGAGLSSADRALLVRLGVPRDWVERLGGGEPFAEILAMFAGAPMVDIDPDAAVVAVVGPEGVVELEAHRTALDLPIGWSPRPVTSLHAGRGQSRRAVTEAGTGEPIVAAVQIQGYEKSSGVRKLLEHLDPDVVIAVVDAAESMEVTRAWLGGLPRIDAIAVDGALDAEEPAGVLSLGLPIVRLDGISIDPIGWTALMCASISAAASR